MSKIFGANQRYLRLLKGWSQTQLAKEMQTVPGWEKYSQVAVSRTEEGSRIVRLDEGVAIARILDSTLEQMITPPHSYTAWIKNLQQHEQKVIEAAKALNEAARRYETARSDALADMQWIERSRVDKKATKSLKESLDREIEQLRHLADLNTFRLLDWIEEEQYKLDDEKFNDEM